jgi:hypothetical protein
VAFGLLPEGHSELGLCFAYPIKASPVWGVSFSARKPAIEEFCAGQKGFGTESIEVVLEIIGYPASCFPDLLCVADDDSDPARLFLEAVQQLIETPSGNTGFLGWPEKGDDLDTGNGRPLTSEYPRQKAGLVGREGDLISVFE